MKSEFTSERGGGRPDESNLDASSVYDASQYRQSVSNFRQDHSAQKPSQRIVSSLTIPGPNEDESSN